MTTVLTKATWLTFSGLNIDLYLICIFGFMHYAIWALTDAAYPAKDLTKHYC